MHQHESLCRVNKKKSETTMTRLGERLQAMRKAVNLSQRQVHFATGISQSQVARTELGRLSTGVAHVSIYSELYGVEDQELFNYSGPVPDPELVRKSVAKFLKKKGIDPKTFLKQHEGATQIIEGKVLKTSFLNTPRFAKEVADYCEEKFGASFTTPQISKAMDSLFKMGLVIKLETEKRSKLQYRRG